VAVCGVLLGSAVYAPAYADDPGPGDAWHPARLELDQAHKLSRGAGVTVAVLDGAVDSHRDLRGALLPAEDVTRPGDPGHGDSTSAGGTATAGLIAARGDGATGLRGIAPEAKILPVRIGADAHTSGPAAAARGIDLAVSRRARVIALSYTESELTDELRRAVRAAVAADVLVVAPGSGLFPSASTVAQLPGVVSVNSTDRTGGAGRAVTESSLDLDLVAPGDELVSLLKLSGRNGDLYRTVSGPEYASAIVAGIAALVRSKYPDLPVAEVIRRLNTTSTDGPARRHLQQGWGQVNPVAALTATPVELPPATPAQAPADPNAGWVPRDSQWYLDALRVPEAQRFSRGAGVTIGMLASGLDVDHPDLRGQVEQPVWVDPNGKVQSGPMPERFASLWRSDLENHTGTAGLAVARGGQGLLGVAPEAKLVAVRGITVSGRDAGPGLRWLTDHGAKVIIVPDGELDAGGVEAVRYAASKDVVLVASANIVDPSPPGVLTVADLRPDGDSMAKDAMLAAPGTGLIVAAAKGTDGQPYGGTVLEGPAAGLVAGVAALVRARYPDLNAASVVNRLLATAMPVQGTVRGDYGRGLVDPLGALTVDLPPVTENPAGNPGAPRGQGVLDGPNRPLWLALLVGGLLLLLVLVAALIVLLVVLRRRRRTTGGPTGGQPGYPAPPAAGQPGYPPPGGAAYPPPGGSGYPPPPPRR